MSFSDLLWSDPIDESSSRELSVTELEEWKDVTYVKNELRGAGYVFGQKAVTNFLDDNNFCSVIR
jgi:hypothetical protein